MRLLLFLFLLSISINFSQEKIDYQKTSQELLKNIKNKTDYTSQVQILASSSLEDLVNQLQTDEQKIAFWVNIYNAFIQISLTKNLDLYQDKSAFFSEKRITIAGEKLSFDDIEHGILRKSKVKIGLGYIRKWFRPKWERKLRVDKVDWRIHFALNCGAKSCPPIAIYNSTNLNTQLNFMTKSYLIEQSKYNSEKNEVETTVLFSWFRGDFGGINGVKSILKSNQITPKLVQNISFSKYDWQLFLDNFREITESKN